MRFYWCSLDYVDPTKLWFNWLIFFDILFQTRVKMYLVPSLNWPLLYSSTMTVCIDLHPVQVRHGTLALSPGFTILIFFAAISIIPRVCSWSRFFALVCCCQIIFSHLHSAHITPCLTHSVQVLWYHIMWSMRSSAHLNCLLHTVHSEQLFVSSGPTSTSLLVRLQLLQSLAPVVT